MTLKELKVKLDKAYFLAPPDMLEALKAITDHLLDNSNLREAYVIHGACQSNSYNNGEGN